MYEQQIVWVLMDILACTERQARSIYIFHIDRPGPAHPPSEPGDAAPHIPPEIPQVIQDTWMAGRL